jgi:hypothetical protein
MWVMGYAAGLYVREGRAVVRPWKG